MTLLFSDDQCWHGAGIWEDCNNKLWPRNAVIRYATSVCANSLQKYRQNVRNLWCLYCRFQGKGCKWWHFYPDEGVKELEEKFRWVGVVVYIVNSCTW